MAKYRNLPAGPLRSMLDASMEPEPASDSPHAAFAHIRMNAEHKCPLLSGEGLCRIQLECGEAFLPSTCARFPRLSYSIGGVQETVLSLSCPEAARKVLLHPLRLVETDLDGKGRTGAAPDGDPLQPFFWPLRDAALALVQNRAYPLWQRLILLSLLGRRFDALAPGDRPRRVPQLLANFRAGPASAQMLAALDRLPADPAQQLDLVLLLAGILLHDSRPRPRFVECIQAFAAGIGNGAGATLASLTARYSEAGQRYFAPFFERHPHLLENYLVNALFRSRFPFGRAWATSGAAPSVARESTLLIAQFALMKGLLIGVAGFHREGFSPEHVVHTIQSASRYFEHHTEFLQRAHNLLVEKRMDGLGGSSILLRSGPASAQAPVRLALPAPAPAGPAAGRQIPARLAEE